MRPPSSLLVLLTLASLATGCLSAFPPSSLDYGRGPKPLERGTLRVQAGGGGGLAPMFLAAGGAVGSRVEVQVSDHIAVGVDGGAGLQAMPLSLTVPYGAHVSTQVNPALDWLALRGSVGVGGDFTSIGGVPLPTVFPWVSGAGSLVLGVPQSWVDFGAFDPYLSLNVGVRRYVLGTDRSFAVPTSAEVELFDVLYAGGLTLGTAWKMSDMLSLYIAANGTAVVTHDLDASSAEKTFGFSPVASVQGGLAFSF